MLTIKCNFGGDVKYSVILHIYIKSAITQHSTRKFTYSKLSLRLQFVTAINEIRIYVTNELTMNHGIGVGECEILLKQENINLEMEY